jgi:hypothetical protein
LRIAVNPKNKGPLPEILDRLKRTKIPNFMILFGGSLALEIKISPLCATGLSFIFADIDMQPQSLLLAFMLQKALYCYEVYLASWLLGKEENQFCAGLTSSPDEFVIVA